MKKNYIVMVIAFVVLLTGGVFLKNQQDKTIANILKIDENSQTIVGIEKILNDSIKLNKWNDFDRIQCKQDDALEKEQMLKEVKEKLQKINSSELDVSHNEDTIFLRKSRTLNNQSELEVKFKVLNTNSERKCIQFIF
jgi:hypothetical protein